MYTQKLHFSNCLLQAIRIKLLFPRQSKIGVDFNSPSGMPSFYCDVYDRFRFRFRRKIRRHSNKGWLLFWGYAHIEDLKTIK